MLRILFWSLLTTVLLIGGYVGHSRAGDYDLAVLFSCVFAAMVTGVKAIHAIDRWRYGLK